VKGALDALAVLVRGLAFDRERLEEACADPLLRAADAAEALVREGVPFRDAHERVAATVREGTFVPPSQVTSCYLEGRGIDVGAAVAAAKKRWS
jgi:argininosuccinate lyase